MGCRVRHHDARSDEDEDEVHVIDRSGLSCYALVAVLREGRCVGFGVEYYSLYICIIHVVLRTATMNRNQTYS